MFDTVTANVGLRILHISYLLNFQKAFNTVLHQHLLHRLKLFGTYGNLKWTESFNLIESNVLY